MKDMNLYQVIPKLCKTDENRDTYIELVTKFSFFAVILKL